MVSREACEFASPESVTVAPGRETVSASHPLRFKAGSDARNHIVSCECGWAYSGTYRGVRKRGAVHVEVFGREFAPWTAKWRQTAMPPNDSSL